MNNVPGKIKISYVLVEIFERPLNIPKRPSIENIGIIYNYGPGVRGKSMNAKNQGLLKRSCEVSAHVFNYIKFKSW